MERTTVGTPHLTAVTFTDYEDEPATLDGACTVTVTDPDGTTIATGTATAADSGHTFPIPAQAAPTILTITWTATIDAVARTIVTTVDVAGGAYTTPSRLRNRYTDIAGDTSKYPAALLRAVIAEFEDMAETATEIALVPRYATDTLLGTGSRILPLRYQAPRSVLSATIDAVAVDLTQLRLHEHGVIERLDGCWTHGEAVTVGYLYGLDRPSAAMSDACEVWASDWLFSDDNLISARANTVTGPEGAAIRISPVGKYGRTGISSVDTAIEAASRTRVTVT